MADQMCYNMPAEIRMAQGCFVFSQRYKSQINHLALVGRQPCIIIRGRKSCNLVSATDGSVDSAGLFAYKGVNMAWDVEMIFTNPDDKRTLPFLATSGQSSAFFNREDATSGEVVGLFVKDEETRQLIRDKDPIILDMFARILDEIDEIAMVMWFDDLWQEHYDDDTLEKRANIVLQSKYASEWKKSLAQDALAYLRGKKRKKVEKKAKRHYSRKRRNQFAGERADLMLALIERDGYQCKSCGSQDDLSIDHITPLSKGGSDDLDNLQLLCRSCNSSKGDSYDNSRQET